MLRPTFYLVLILLLFIVNGFGQITIWKIDEQHNHSVHHNHTEVEDLGEEAILYPCGTSYYSELHSGESVHTSFWSLKNESTSTVTITDPISITGGIDRFILEANTAAVDLDPGEELHFRVTYNGLSGLAGQINIQSTIGSCSLIVDGGTSVSVCSINWDGSAIGSWEMATNWDLNRIPIDGDLVCIFNADVTISSSATADAVWVEDGSLTISLNHSLTLDGTSIWIGGSSLANGLNLVNSSYTNNGSQIINNVPGNGIYLENSTFINSSGASVNINSPDDEGLELDNGISTFTNNGTINISDANADGIDLDGDSFVFTNNGIIAIDESGSEGIDLESSQSSTVINNGSISISNTSDEGIEVQNENIFLNSGNLSISDTDDDDIDVEEDGVFRNSGTITLNSPSASDAIEVESNGFFENQRCGLINVQSEKIDIDDTNSRFENYGVIALNEEDNDNDGTMVNIGRIVTPSGSITFDPNGFQNDGELVAGVVPTTASLCVDSIPTISQWGIFILMINFTIIGLLRIKGSHIKNGTHIA